MCLHAKHVFSNHFGWYLSFNCIITEKCMFFYNDPSTFAWHDFVSLDYTADVKADVMILFDLYIIFELFLKL
jgi:hypothetical protein